MRLWRDRYTRAVRYILHACPVGAETVAEIFEQICPKILPKMTFAFPNENRLHLTGEVDKSVRFHVKFFQDLSAKNH